MAKLSLEELRSLRGSESERLKKRSIHGRDTHVESRLEQRLY